MMKEKVSIGCPSCQKRYHALADLNRHIAKTKCNGGLPVTQIECLVMIGLLKPVPIVQFNSAI